ncbi:hypothetical protein [Pseudomonas yamanorum]|uniref:hypothetical protein n=1 Tax=Pseudomonas yamanorum TaxID=515393 RepID=UPI003D3632F9
MRSFIRVKLRWIEERMGCRGGKSSACPLAGRYHAKALGGVVDQYVVAFELFQTQEVVGASFLGQAFCFVEGCSVLFLLGVSLVGIGGISWLRGGIPAYISISSVTAAYGSALTAGHFWQTPQK